MEKPALKVEDISIRFNLSKEKVDNLKELLIKKIKGETIRFNEFWALKNINFELLVTIFAPSSPININSSSKI